MRNSIEKLFEDDVREKKRTGSGIHHRTGKRGYVGKMMFAYDFMSRSEKLKHRKAGKVIVSNIYDEINMDFEELKAKPKEEMKRYLSEWQKRFTNTEIAKGLDMPDNKLYYWLRKFGLSGSTGVTEDQKRVATTTVVKDVNHVPQTPYINLPYVPPAPPVVLPKLDGIQFAFTGKHSSEKIIATLTKLQLLLEGESNDFEIKIFLEEKHGQPKELREPGEYNG
jgi:hypothetical protein